MKTPGMGDIKKAKNLVKYHEVVELVSIDDIVVEEIFSRICDKDPKVIERISKSISSTRFHRNKPLLIWFRNGRLVVVDGHQRLEAAKRAGLTQVWVIQRVFRSEEEAILAAKDEQDNRRNRNLNDVFTMLRDNLRARPAHRPKKTPPNGGLIEEGAEEEIDPRYPMEQILDITGLSKRTLERYRQLLCADTEGLIKEAQDKETDFEGALKRIRVKIFGPGKPKKLSEKVVVKAMFPNPEIHQKWLEHCAAKGRTSPREALLQLAYVEMGMVFPFDPNYADGALQKAEAAGAGKDNEAPVDPPFTEVQMDVVSKPEQPPKKSTSAEEELTPPPSPEVNSLPPPKGSSCESTSKVNPAVKGPRKFKGRSAWSDDMDIIVLNSRLAFESLEQTAQRMGTDLKGHKMTADKIKSHLFHMGLGQSKIMKKSEKKKVQKMLTKLLKDNKQ